MSRLLIFHAVGVLKNLFNAVFFFFLALERYSYVCGEGDKIGPTRIAVLFYALNSLKNA